MADYGVRELNGSKIIAGLRDAVAYARGDVAAAHVSVVKTPACYYCGKPHNAVKHCDKWRCPLAERA